MTFLSGNKNNFEGMEIYIMAYCDIFVATRKCDQMARLFFHILPFTAIKICQISDQICQSRFKNNKLSNIVKIF